MKVPQVSLKIRPKNSFFTLPAILAALLAVSPGASGITTFNPSSGDYLTPGNWNAGIPGNTDFSGDINTNRTATISGSTAFKPTLLTIATGGTLVLASGANLTVNGTTKLSSAATSGNVIQNAGSSFTTTTLQIGSGTNGTLAATPAALYTMNGGNLTVTGALGIPGANTSNGSMVMNDGTVSAGSLTIGTNGGAGSLTMSGGTMNVTGALSTSPAGGSNIGTATIAVSGGTLNFLAGGASLAPVGGTASNTVNFTVSGNGVVNLNGRTSQWERTGVTLRVSGGAMNFGNASVTFGSTTSFTGGQITGINTISNGGLTINGSGAEFHVGSNTNAASNTTMANVSGNNFTLTSGKLVFGAFGNGSADQLVKVAIPSVNISSGSVVVDFQYAPVVGDRYQFLSSNSGTMTTSTSNIATTSYDGLWTVGWNTSNWTTGVNATTGSLAINTLGLGLASGKSYTLSGYSGSATTVNMTGGNLTANGSNTVGAVTVSSGTIGGAGNLTASSYTFTDSGNVTASLQGAPATLTKSGSGTVTLSGNNTYAGGTTLSAGTLQIGHANALGTSGTISLAGGTLQYGTGITADLSSRFSTASSQAYNIDTFGNDVLYASALTSSGGTLTKNGSGTLTLSNAGNTYTGTTTVNAGTLTLSGGLNNSSVTVNGGVLNQTAVGTIAGTDATFTLASGNATLAGANTYAGATTINGGTLNLTGSNAGSATAINSGGALIGTGSAGAVTVNSGGFIGAGNAPATPGTITVGSLTLNGGGTYTWDFGNTSGTAGTNWDLLSVSNDLTINATSGNKFTVAINGTPTGWAPSTAQTWNIINYGSLANAFDASVFNLSTSLTGAGVWSFTNDTSNNSIGLTYSISSISTWNGGSGNWSSGFSTTPTNGTPLVFAGAGGTATNDISSASLSSLTTITINSTAGSYTLAANSGSSGFDASVPLSLTGITNNSANATTINLALAVTNTPLPVNAAAGNIIMGGPISNNNTITFSGANSTTVSGVISGTGAIIQNSASTLTLSGNNTYTGTTAVNSGTLEIASAGRLGGGNYSQNITNNGTFLYSGANDQTLSGIISGTGSLTQNNSASRLTLSGNNTYTGATTVNSGTLEIASTGQLGGGNYSQNIINNGTFLYSGANDQTLSGLISGTGALTQNNSASTLTLSNNNTYTGTTTLNAGTLALLGGLNNSSVTVNGGALTLSGGLNNSSVTVNGGVLNQTAAGTIAGTGTTFTLTSGNATLSGSNTYTGATTVNAGTLTLTGGLNNSSVTVNGGVLNQTAAGTIAGTGTTFTLTSGNATLSGSNTYTGGTTLSAGNLQIGHANALGTTANGTTVSNGAALELSGGITIGAEALSLNGSGISSTGALRNISGNNAYGGVISLAGATTIGSDAGNLTLSSGSSITGTNTNLTIVGSGNITINDAIATVTGTLTKNGTGTLTLSGSNTYTGATTINAGTLQIGAGSITGSLSSSSAITNNGTLAINRSNPIIISNTITGSGGVLKRSGNTVTLSGNNSYTGGTTIAAGGNIVMGADNALGNGALIYNAGGTATLQLNGTNQTITNLSHSGSGVIENAGSGTGTLTFNIADGVNCNSNGILYRDTSGKLALVKTGNGTLDFSLLPESNTGYSGGLTVNGGTFSYNSTATTAALGMGNITLGGGTLNYAGSTAQSITNNITLTAGTSSTLNNDNSTITVSGTIGGSGNLTKSGAGTLVLSGANSYSGTTTVSAGNLTITSGTALADNGAVTLANTTGAVLSVSTSETIGSLSGGGASGGNVVIGSGQTLTVNQTTDTTFSGAISGANLVKTGSGTLTMNGSNTYTGTTTVNSGTLQAAAAGATGNSTVINVTGGSFLVTAGNAVSDSTNINLGGGTLAMSGNFNESVGALTLSANSTIDFSGFVGTLRFSGVGSWATGANLAIWNWSGRTQYGTDYGTYPNSSNLVFTNNATLTNNLANISFYSDSGTTFIGSGFEQGFTGGGTEIIAVPEPETYLTGVILLLGGIIYQLRLARHGRGLLHRLAFLRPRTHRRRFEGRRL